MAKKRQTQSTSLGQTQRLIQSLQQAHVLKPWLELIRAYTEKRNMPSLNQQLLDIQLNVDGLKEYPLARIQLLRLIEKKSQQDINAFYTAFEAIWADYLDLSPTSRQIIDPYTKSERDYSSSVNQYKKWLLQVIFVLVYLEATAQSLAIAPQTILEQTDEVILEVLAFFNHIYYATTTSRVTLRDQPNIQAQAILDLPRQQMLQVIGQPINTHWLKVQLPHENETIVGHLQAVYIKVMI